MPAARLEAGEVRLASNTLHAERSIGPGGETAGFKQFRLPETGRPTPGRAEGFLFGVCSHPERWGKRVRELEAEAAGLCGAKVMRNDTEWNLIQPEPGIWNYSLFDHIVEAFGKRGIELNAILAYSPLWARDREQFPRQDAWRNFVRRTVERYRDRIRFWEVWNEPDLPGFAPFGSDRYVEMLKNAYTEIKLAAPEAVVLTRRFRNQRHVAADACRSGSAEADSGGRPRQLSGACVSRSRRFSVLRAAG